MSTMTLVAEYEELPAGFLDRGPMWRFPQHPRPTTALAALIPAPQARWQPRRFEDRTLTCPDGQAHLLWEGGSRSSSADIMVRKLRVDMDYDCSRQIAN